MLTDHELERIYQRGHETSHVTGLRLVADAAQLDLYQSEPPHHHHPHHEYIEIDVPVHDAKANLDFKVV